MANNHLKEAAALYRRAESQQKRFPPDKRSSYELIHMAGVAALIGIGEELAEANRQRREHFGLSEDLLPFEPEPTEGAYPE